MSVYFAEAYCDENKKDGYEGSKAGDQLQTVSEQSEDFVGECRLSKWRDMKATVVFRYKDREKAKAHAEAAKFFVDSKYVGYSQPNRLTLKNKIKSLGYANYKKLNKNVECDCSSLQCLCSNIVGISEVKDWNTAAMLTEYAKLTDYFESLYDEKYLRSPDYLMEGDILVRNGHTACVIGNGDKVNPEPTPAPTPVNPNDKDGNGKIDVLQPAKSFNSSIAGKYVATTAVNLRYGPSSAKYDVITVVKEGETVTNYGYYTNDWYYVRTSKGLIGFIKSTYLKKKK